MTRQKYKENWENKREKKIIQDKNSDNNLQTRQIAIKKGETKNTKNLPPI